MEPTRLRIPVNPPRRKQLESGLDVRKVITRRMKADDYAEAFKLAAGGEKGKIVLDWS